MAMSGMGHRREGSIAYSNLHDRPVIIRRRAKLPEPFMTYDLLLKGGHVIDPAEGRDGVADVAFKDDKVAVVAGRLSDGDAAEVRSAEGLYVVPGLIDLHTHVYWGGTIYGVDPDQLARASGMTTAVDAGSAGAGNIRGLVDLQQSRTDVRLLAFVNLSYPGIFSDLRAVNVGEAEDLRVLNVPHVVKVTCPRDFGPRIM
jgi:dihydroorotase